MPLTEEILRDPFSEQVSLILFLYSIEPPFYAFLNQACREMDESKLPSLGPYARVVHVLL